MLAITALSLAARTGAESPKFQCNGDATPGAQQPTAIGQRRTWEKEAPGNEPIANALLVSLLHEGLVPEGGVLDVGAFDGHFARFYANLMPDRKIFAIDPAMHNVNKMRKQMKAVPNLCTLWGAVGVRDEPAQVSVSLDELSLKDKGPHHHTDHPTTPTTTPTTPPPPPPPPPRHPSREGSGRACWSI